MSDAAVSCLIDCFVVKRNTPPPTELGRDVPSVEGGAVEGRVGILHGEEAGVDRGGQPSIAESSESR